MFAIFSAVHGPARVFSRSCMLRFLSPVSNVAVSSTTGDSKKTGTPKSGERFTFRWPSKEEMSVLIDFERQFEPPLSVLLDKFKKDNMTEEKSELERNRMIASAMEKMPSLLKQHLEKKQKRMGELSKVEDKRQQLVDEAREHFGYDISPRDPRFLELLERKQEEEKKLKKKMRKDKKVERAMSWITRDTSTAKKPDESSDAITHTADDKEPLKQS